MFNRKIKISRTFFPDGRKKSERIEKNISVGNFTELAQLLIVAVVLLISMLSTDERYVMILISMLEAINK